MKRDAVIDRILKPICEAVNQAYISTELQVADVLEWMLDQREFCASKDDGSSESRVVVYQTTFSISEEFLRRIYNIKKRHRNVCFEVIIDRKALQKTVQLWRFISAVYDRVFIADNHSKILVVESGPVRAALVTSQNLTRGNRHESAVLSTDCAIVEPLLADYFSLRDNRSATMSDIVPAGGADLVPVEGRDGGEVDFVNEIERLAGFFVPLSDIAVVLGLDHGRLRAAVSCSDHPWSLAYRRGKAKAKIAIRAKEMEFANTGSPIAIQNVRENLIDMESDED